MSEKEKEIGQTIEKVLSKLPDGKKEYLLGYAEGLAAMADQQKQAANGDQDSA